MSQGVGPVLLPGDILLVAGDGPWAPLIRRVTGSRWTHCALAVDERQIAEVGAGYRLQVAPLHYSDCLVLRHPQLDTWRRNRIAGFARAHLGAPYDWTAFAAAGLRVRARWEVTWSGPGRFTCTTLVVQAYAHIGVDLAMGRGTLAPHELLETPPLTQVAA